ncbi:hypothetical protein BLNAU_17142 [Blattamonas nauphoetae]|uniref:Uncharacterized protein n=1 Tax=Blattamonas nauphoetae TaxID=2049346 RepID=A0ABQ9X9C6_9EUKA|nr:hypothetical protein BLNAU_17142 [Blattamonas nauphoetae]
MSIQITSHNEWRAFHVRKHIAFLDCQIRRRKQTRRPSSLFHIQTPRYHPQETVLHIKQPQFGRMCPDCMMNSVVVEICD